MSAVDISLNYLSELGKNSSLELIAADAENLPFKNHFDFIVSTDVLEHVLNPGNFMYSLNEALKPEGTVVVRVPIDEDLLIYSSFLGCQYDIVHLRSFNKSLLRQVFKNSGFSVKEIKLSGHSLNLKYPYYANGRPRIQNYLSNLRNLLAEKGITELELASWPTWLANLLSPPYVAIVVATKTHRIVPAPNTNFRLESL